MSTFSRLFDELRRRNVLKAGGAYVAGGWVFFQFAEALLPLVGTPDWVLQALMILLIIGLPFILAFSWAFELTPEGLKRTEDVDPAASETKETGRKIQYLIIGLLAVAVVGLLVDRFASAPPRSTVSAASVSSTVAFDFPDDVEAVAVMPFKTTGPDTDIWREGMMSMLTTNLDGMGSLRAVDVRTVLARLRERGAEAQDADLQATLAAARTAGARTAVVGDVVSTGEIVRLSAVLYDTESGSVLRRLQVEGPEPGFLQLVDRLTVNIVEAARSREQAGGTLPVPNLSALTTESLSALRAYLEGEDLYRRAHYREAVVHLRQATELDSTFAMAHLRLASTTAAAEEASPNMVQDVQARLRKARRHGGQLPPREATLLDGYFAYAVEGNVARSARAYRDGLQDHSTDPELWGKYGETLLSQPNTRPGALEDGLKALRRAIQLDSSFTTAYKPVIGHQISTGDTAGARRLLDAYARHDRNASASGVLRSLRGALDLAYGDSTAQSEVLRWLRQDAPYPNGWLYMRGMLQADPTPEALRAQALLGEAWIQRDSYYSTRTSAWIFGGRYDDLRVFIRDTTAMSRSARLQRQRAASVLLERGAMSPTDVPSGLLAASCQMEVPLRYRIRGCLYEARIAARLDGAGRPGRSAAEAVQAARSVLEETAKKLRSAGNGAYGTLATGYQVLIGEMAALGAGDPEAPKAIQAAYEPLLLIRSTGDWEPMAASVRTQIRVGEAAAALPYAETITAQDPHGHYLAGQAHEALSDVDAAREAYKRFVSAWRDADPDIPALQHAQAVLGGTTSGAPTL